MEHDIKILSLFNYSQEEIESLREKMTAQTSLVVVGSADDALRVNKLKRQMEGVSQSMIDSMIVVSIFCLTLFPMPRKFNAILLIFLLLLVHISLIVIFEPFQLLLSTFKTINSASKGSFWLQ